MGTWSFSPALSSVGLTSTTSNNNVTIKISNKATALDNAGKTIVATFKDDDGCTKSTEFVLKNCSSSPSSSCKITGSTINASDEGNVTIGKLPRAYGDGVTFNYENCDWLGIVSYKGDTTETDFYPIIAGPVQSNPNADSRSVTVTVTCVGGTCDGCQGGTFTVTQLGTGGGCTELTTQCDTYINFTFQDKETTSSTYGINSLCTFYLKKNGQDIPVTFFKYNALDSGTCNKFRFEPTGSPDNVELKNLQFFYNKTVQDLIDYQSNELDGEELFFLKGSTTNQTHNDNTNVSNKLHSFLTGNTLDIVNNCVGLEFSTTTPPVLYQHSTTPSLCRKERRSPSVQDSVARCKVRSLVKAL